MVKSKEKGGRWERESVKLLNREFPGVWRKIPASGSIGTYTGLPLLKGDVIGLYEFLHKKFVGEAKVGYGGKSMTIQKEWFDKIKNIAEELYAWPVVILKFEKSRSGVKHVICLDFDTWDQIMKTLESMDQELNKLYDEQEPV